MSDIQRLGLVEQKVMLNCSSNEDEYTPKQVASIIKRYPELRSTIEISAARQEQVSGSSPGTGKEEIICVLADIDQGMDQLSPRQQLVIQMLKQGYQYEAISNMLNISVATVNFHVRQAVMRLTTYLNS